MRTIRIFVSSPGDVAHERERVDRVVMRLNGELGETARFETVRWETKFYQAHRTFQAQIPEAADCDVVIAVFWSRLGSELPPGFPPMFDGRPYPSGSAYEVLSAIEARAKNPFPDVYVFKKTAEPLVPLNDRHKLASAQAQWERLEAFFETWFKTPEGHFLAAFHTFRTPDQFETSLEALLRHWVASHVAASADRVSWPIATRGSPFRGLDALRALSRLARRGPAC